MVVGLTGALGTGKSTAATFLSTLGYRLIDSDAIVRDHVLTDPEVIEKIRNHLGESILAKNGQVDRKLLGDKVFNHPEHLRWLEELTHPRVFAEWRRQIRQSPHDNWAIEVILLFEGRLEIWFDFTVCVACSRPQQLARLEKRGLPRALAELRISQQLPLTQKIELADFVLWNDGATEFLQAEVRELIATLSSQV